MKLKINLDNAQSGGSQITILLDNKIVWQDRLHLIAEGALEQDGISLCEIDVDDFTKYSKDNFADKLQHAKWKTYKKKVNTKAVRMLGPFEVLTSEGTLSCKDGYLATDARGYPYPIATDEFELIYDEVKEESKNG